MTDVLCMCWGERQGILLVLTHSSHVASCVGVRVALYLFSHTSSVPVRAMSSPSSSYALKFANRWIFFWINWQIYLCPERDWALWWSSVFYILVVSEVICTYAHIYVRVPEYNWGWTHSADSLWVCGWHWHWSWRLRIPNFWHSCYSLFRLRFRFCFQF